MTRGRLDICYDRASIMPPRNHAQIRYNMHSELRERRGDVRTQKDAAVNRNSRTAAAFSFAHI
jgi:hypothetical protein